jgi:hypothetical protein
MNFIKIVIKMEISWYYRGWNFLNQPLLKQIILNICVVGWNSSLITVYVRNNRSTQTDKEIDL